VQFAGEFCDHTTTDVTEQRISSHRLSTGEGVLSNISFRDYKKELSYAWSLLRIMAICQNNLSCSRLNYGRNKIINYV